MRLVFNDEMEEIRDFFKDLSDIYFVGGCVRDAVLGITPKDYDLVTVHKPEEIETYIKGKGKRAYLVGKRFGTIGVKIGKQMVEVTTYRTEDYSDGTRKPEVQFTTSLVEDLSRRDFTINTLVCDFHWNVKNHFLGLDDLKNQKLKAVSFPKHRFKEDPLRILRAIRFAAKYHLDIEEKTLEKLQHCRWELFRISKERIVDEITKIMQLPPSEAHAGLQMLWYYEIWQVVFPEMQLQQGYEQNSPHHPYPLHLHSLTAFKLCRETTDDKKMLWTAILHDVAKPFTRTQNPKGHSNYINHDILGAQIVDRWLQFYKFSNEDRTFIVDTIKVHLEPTCWLRPFDNGAKQ